MSDLEITGRVVVSTEGAETAFDRVSDKADKMATGIAGAAGKAGTAVDGIGAGADKGAQQFTRAGASIRNEIERSTKSLEQFGKTASEKLELKIQAKGLDAAQFEPYLNELRKVEKAQADAAKSSGAMNDAYGRGVVIGDSIKTAMVGIAVASVAAGAAFYALFDKFSKMAGDFQDMAEKTGDTSANLASLAVAAAVGGTSMEAFVGAASKLTKGLTGVDDESKAAGAAIKALGLNLEEFKGLKSADQLETLGKALNGFKEGPEKAAVAMALLGKSGAELLPFLKALGEEGGRQNILTSAQIALADEYADKQAKLRAELSLQAQALATSLIPTYNGLSEVLKETAMAMVGLNNASSNGEINEKLVSVVQQTAIFFAQLSDVVYRAGASFAILGNNIGAVAAMAASLASGDLAGARAIGAAANEFNDDFKFTLGLADAVEKKFAEINKQAATARAVFNDPRRLGEVGTIAEQTLANNGKTLSFSGSAKSEGVTKASLSEYDKLIQKLGVELPKAAAEAEAAQNGYNKAQTEFVALANGPAWAKFTAQQKANVAALYESKIASEQAEAEQKKLDKATMDAATSREKYIVSLSTGLDKIKADTQAQIEATARMGLSKEAIAALDAAKLEMLATDLELQAIKALDKNLDEEAYNGLKKLAQGYRDLAKAKQGGAERETAMALEKASVDAANNSAKEWQKTANDIERALTDSLMRGFESGKSMWESFRDYITNSAKSWIIKIAVQPVMGIVNGILGGMGMPGMGAASSSGMFGGAGMLGQIGAGLGAFGTGASYGLQSLFANGLGGTLSAGGSMLGAGSTMAGLGTIIGALGPIVAGLGVLRSLTGYTVSSDGSALVANANAHGVSAVANRDDFTQSSSGILSGGTTHNSAWSDANSEISRYFDTAVATSVASAKQYAQALGLSADAADSFAKQIEVSITGMNPEQQRAAIDAAVGKFTDDLVSTTWGPAMQGLAFTGETASQTMARLATDLTTVNSWLGVLDGSLISVSVTGAATAASLVAAFGGLDKLNESMGAYYSNYYSQEEQRQAKLLSIQADLAGQGINLSIDQLNSVTKEGVRAWVDAAKALYDAGVFTAEQLAHIISNANMIAPILVTSGPGNSTMSPTDESTWPWWMQSTVSGTNPGNSSTSAGGGGGAGGGNNWQDGIKDWLDRLNSTNNGVADVMRQTQTAWASYSTQLALAKGGDAKARGDITGYADTYLAALKNTSKTMVDEQLAIARVKDQMLGLIDQKTPAEKIVDAITTTGNGITTAIYEMGGGQPGGGTGARPVVILPANLPPVQTQQNNTEVVDALERLHSRLQKIELNTLTTAISSQNTATTLDQAAGGGRPLTTQAI